MPVIPLLFLSIIVLADSLASEWRAPAARVTGVVIAGMWLLFVVHGASRIRFTAFREWPNHAVVPDVLATIALQQPTALPAVTLGHPWYLHTTLRYYAAHGAPPWLRIPDQSRASLPRWDYMLLDRSMERPPGYETVKEYEAAGVTLLRRTAPAG
jgi:hypothetical protein